MKKPAGEWEEIDLKVVKHPLWIKRAWKNNRYFVTVRDDQPTSNGGTCIRVMVQKRNDTPIMFHWKEMQKIKNELFGEKTLAIEYYPPENKCVDVANIYWFCIFPDGVIPELVGKL